MPKIPIIWCPGAKALFKKSRSIVYGTTGDAHMWLEYSDNHKIPLCFLSVKKKVGRLKRKLCFVIFQISETIPISVLDCNYNLRKTLNNIKISVNSKIFKSRLPLYMSSRSVAAYYRIKYTTKGLVTLRMSFKLLKILCSYFECENLINSFMFLSY